MELTYTKCGDYLIPNLVLSDTKEYHIGKYGRLRRAYLKEHRPILYTDLIVTWRKSTSPAGSGWKLSKKP